MLGRGERGVDEEEWRKRKEGEDVETCVVFLSILRSTSPLVSGLSHSVNCSGLAKSGSVTGPPLFRYKLIPCAGRRLHDLLEARA